MKNYYWIPLLVVFAVSGMAGYRAGFSMISLIYPKPIEEAQDYIATLNHSPNGGLAQDNGQLSILVIGTDNLKATHPKLEGVWLILFVPPDPHLTFLPVYPSISNNQKENSRSLSKLFRLYSSKGVIQVDQTFYKTLHEQDLWWSGYILLDRSGMATLFDQLSTTKPSQMTSNSASLPINWKDSLRTLPGQVNYYQEICWRANQLDTLAEIAKQKDVSKLLSGHAVSNLNNDQVISIIHSMQLHKGSLVCDFPTLSALSQITP